MSEWPGPAGAGTGAARPLIGISSYREHASWSSWSTEAVLVPDRYVTRVAEAGGIPVVLPSLQGIEDVITRLDGLVLAGGGDLDPSHYRAAREENCGPANAQRDSAELALCQAALARRLPVLGICRGLQVMNVALGGTLHQYLPEIVGHNGHAPQIGGYGAHEVSVAPGSLLASALRRTDLTDHLPVVVPTHHHQAVDRLGDGLTATALATDGMIEAVELDPARHPFAVGVQWHPEAGEDLSLIQALVSASARQAEPVTA